MTFWLTNRSLIVAQNVSVNVVEVYMEIDMATFSTSHCQDGRPALTNGMKI